MKKKKKKKKKKNLYNYYLQILNQINYFLNINI